MECARILKILPFGHVRVSGIIPIQLDVADLLTSELGHFLILAFLLCVITLCAYFRSFSTVGACLLLVVISDIGALGYMALAGYSFSILSTSVPILASITALVIGTHTLINYANEWREDVLLHGNPNRTERAVKTYASLFLPNFLMAFTTAVGFATLTTSSVPAHSPVRVEHQRRNHDLLAARERGAASAHGYSAAASGPQMDVPENALGSLGCQKPLGRIFDDRSRGLRHVVARRKAQLVSHAL